MEKKHLIGLSLSFCCRDIAMGKIQLDQVKMISTGTRIKNHSDLQIVIDQYLKTYWNGFPEAATICHHLFKEGKIYQPRLKGKLSKWSRFRKNWIPCV